MAFSRWNPRPPAFDERLRADYQTYAREHRLAELCEELRTIDPDLTLPRMKGRAAALGLQVSANRGAHPSQRLSVYRDPAEVLRSFEAFEKSGVSVSRWCKRHGYNRETWSRACRAAVGEERWDKAVEHNWPDYTWYVVGRQLEYSVVAALKRHGWWPQRSKRSLTSCDVSGMRADVNVIVQCKVHGYLPPAEWNELMDLAEQTGAVPLLATHDKTMARISFYELLDRKTGDRRQRQPYRPVQLTPDGLVPITA